MAKSSKLVAAKRGRILLVRRRRDRLWMFPGGRRRGRETEKDCLRREIRKELPKLKLGRLKLLKEGRAKKPRSGRKMSDAIFKSFQFGHRISMSVLSRGISVRSIVLCVPRNFRQRPSIRRSRRRRWRPRLRRL